MSRREFLGMLIFSGVSLFGNPLAKSEEQANLSLEDYSNAANNPEKRQEYVNRLLKENGKLWQYAACLKYEENPKQFAIGKMIEYAMQKRDEKVTIIQIDGERIRNSYAYVVRDIEDFGKKKKSEVYVFPKLFDKLQKDEADIVVYHENVHCKDIFEGIILGNKKIDARKLESSLDTILELRAGYYQLEHIFSTGMKQKKDFLKRVRLPFIQEREGEYVRAYMELKALMENKLSEEEKMAVREHLLNFGKWIKPSSQYKE
ncbi:hypothetical protein HYW76_03420 [Candidatus Pacearchaeota archaeon]|nr:hypothetical protein [Candidatus Pacearchaeota archaeon]